MTDKPTPLRNDGIQWSQEIVDRLRWLLLERSQLFYALTFLMLDTETTSFQLRLADKQILDGYQLTMLPDDPQNTTLLEVSIRKIDK